MFSVNQYHVLAPLVNVTSLFNARPCVARQVTPRRHKHPEQTSAAGNDDAYVTCLRELGLSNEVEIRDPCLEAKNNIDNVSNNSFYENRNGFHESVLSRISGSETPPPIVPSKLLQNSIFQNSDFRQFIRTFKTRSTPGIGRKSREPESSLGDDGFVGLFAAKGKSSKQSDKFRQMLTEFEGTPNVQEKLKLAFAEGYAIHSTDKKFDSKSWAARGMRLLLLAFAIWLVLQFVTVSTSVGGSMRGLGVLNRDQYEVNPEDITVSFEDVKGCDEAKQELLDVVEFLKDPEKFTVLGAKLPKGVLLVGSPGVGKTLLARAVAGEAGVPFFHASGSEFDEIFVGTGAKRVRQLFTSAKIRAPCVIFIDEIDTVGAKRTSSQIHPYANQTINQLLSEMDGFQQNEGVIVLGATNRRDNLDKALLRPGRFDVEVSVHSPDLKGRRDIFLLYLEKVKYDRDVDVDKLARGTTGFTGADIENMVNQAALKAAMDLAPHVNMTHLDFARDKVMMGPAKKTRIPDEETNWITSYHEAGHTLVAFFTKDATPLHKVTIIPRGTSLGHTAFLPEKEAYNHTKSQLLARMDVAMGGRVAEEMIYGTEKVTTGAGNDFDQATGIATAMVKKFGMSDKVGVRVFQDEGQDSGLSMVKVNDVSPATTELIDNEIKRLLSESYERAKIILKQNAVAHKDLAKALMKYETLDKDDIEAIVNGKKDFVPSTIQ